MTWEERILALERADSLQGTKLRALVPGLRLLNPPGFLEELRRLDSKAEPWRME